MRAYLDRLNEADQTNIVGQRKMQGFITFKIRKRNFHPLNLQFLYLVRDPLVTSLSNGVFVFLSAYFLY